MSEIGSRMKLELGSRGSEIEARKLELEGWKSEV